MLKIVLLLVCWCKKNNNNFELWIVTVRGYETDLNETNLTNFSATPGFVVQVPVYITISNQSSTTSQWY